MEMVDPNGVPAVRLGDASRPTRPPVEGSASQTNASDGWLRFSQAVEECELRADHVEGR